MCVCVCVCVCRCVEVCGCVGVSASVYLQWCWAAGCFYFVCMCARACTHQGVGGRGEQWALGVWRCQDVAALVPPAVSRSPPVVTGALGTVLGSKEKRKKERKKKKGKTSQPLTAGRHRCPWRTGSTRSRPSCSPCGGRGPPPGGPGPPGRRRVGNCL